MSINHSSLAILLLLFSMVTVDEPSFRIVTKRIEDTVEVKSTDDKTYLTVRSPSGIGSAVVHRPIGGWPVNHDIVLRLHLKGLEQLSISASDVQWLAAVSSSDPKPALRLKKGAIETEITGSKDRYWSEVKHAGHFELTIPKALLADKPESITLSWIDFFR